MSRTLVQHGDAMTVLLRLVADPDPDPEELARHLLRLGAEDQVLLGGTLIRIGRNGDRYRLAQLGEALACRGARRLSARFFPDLNEPRTT